MESRRMSIRAVLVLVCVVCVLGRFSDAQVFDFSLNNFRHHHRWQQTPASNLSQTPVNSSQSGLLVEGFSCLAVAVIGFGSSLVPIKRLDTGDGMFFQFVYCSTLALESLLVYVIRGCPDIWAFSAVGGVIYGLGNIVTIPILKTVGLGVGFLIWSVFTLLMAWATARFGWFGLDRQNVPNPTLNCIGTALTTISALILFFVTIEEEKEDERSYEEETKPLLHRNSISSDKQDSPVNPCIHSDIHNTSWAQGLSPMTKKIIGCSLATFAGLVYGCAYTPIIYIKNDSLRNGTSFPGASQFDLDYIFPYMTGMNTLTSIAFLGYCIVMRNTPVLPVKCVLPAFCSASVMFSAQCVFFTACYCLGTVVTYPIGTAGPALVSLSWSVFYFKEIKGIKNFLLVAAVVATVLSGVTLISLSKIEF